MCVGGFDVVQKPGSLTCGHAALQGPLLVQMSGLMLTPVLPKGVRGENFDQQREERRHPHQNGNATNRPFLNQRSVCLHLSHKLALKMKAHKLFQFHVCRQKRIPDYFARRRTPERVMLPTRMWCSVKCVSSLDGYSHSCVQNCPIRQAWTLALTGIRLQSAVLGVTTQANH